jgi:Txe/YoeB family toxin of toxin-antitoxin system
MEAWQIVLTKKAAKDAKRHIASGLREKIEALLAILQRNPLEPPYKKLTGDMSGAFSRRINIQHRVV